MAGESSITLNPGQGGPESATYQDQGDRHHQVVVIETQSGTGDPARVGASNPLPISGAVTVTSGLITVSGTATVAGTVNAVGEVASGSNDSGNPIKVGGKYNASPISLSNGQRGDLQLDANGYVKVNIAAGAAAGGTSSNFGSATPAAGTAAGFSDGTNLQPAKVYDLDSGGGTDYVQGVVIRRTNSGGSIEVGTAAAPFVVGGAVAAGVAASGNPVPIAGIYLSSAPTYSNGQAGALQVDASGNLKVNIQSGGGSGGTASSFGAAVPASGTAVGFSGGTNMQAGRVVDLDTGAGTFYGQAVSIRLSGNGSTGEGGSTSSPLAVQGNAASAATDSGNPVKVGGVYNSSAPTFTNGQRGDLQLDVNGSLKVNLTAGGVPGFQDNTAFTAGTSQGMMLMGYLDDTSSSVLTENNAGAVRMNSNRALHITPRANGGGDMTDSTANALKVIQVASTTGGSTPFKHVSGAGAASTFFVKASAGKLHMLHGVNKHATNWAYVKLYNQTTAPTVGNTGMVATFGVPPGAGFNLHFGEGIALATGIAFTITGAPADNDTTVLGSAGDVVLSGTYS